MSTSTVVADPVAGRVACEPRTAFVLAGGAARTALATGTPNPPAAAVTPAGFWLAGPDVETDPQD